jgi:hypothetical protein
MGFMLKIEVIMLKNKTSKGKPRRNSFYWSFYSNLEIPNKELMNGTIQI